MRLWGCMGGGTLSRTRRLAGGLGREFGGGLFGLLGGQWVWQRVGGHVTLVVKDGRL